MPAAAAAGPRVEAEELVETAAERDALTGLREATGTSDGAMERHGLRCFFICERLADQHGLEVDRELLLVAGLVHDIGLYEEVSDGGVYVAEGRRFADGLLAGREGWDTERIERCGLAIERHHELRPQWEAGPEVELLRRADLIELSGGLIDYGVGRGWLRGLWRAVPRDGTIAEIGGMVLKALRERPATLPQVFLRG